MWRERRRLCVPDRRIQGSCAIWKLDGTLRSIALFALAREFLDILHAQKPAIQKQIADLRTALAYQTQKSFSY
jgi:hypothetical protein